MHSLDPKDIQRALLSFDRGTARRGQEYFQAGRVVSAELTGEDRYRLLVKGSRPEGYTVEIKLSRAPWTNNCSCPVASHCKHVYASLLFLEKHGDFWLTGPTSKDQPTRRTGFFGLVPKGSRLSEKEIAFIKLLERLYQTHQCGDGISGFLLEELFPSWKPASAWGEVQVAPERELTRLQFWHFLVAALTQKQIPVPKIFGASNDISPSLQLIQEWQDQLLHEEWEQAYRQHPPVLPDQEQSDYRWLFEDDHLILEVKHWSEPLFRKIRAEEFQWLRYNHRSQTSVICPGAVLLVTEHLQFEYSYSPKVSVTLSLAKRLNALLQKG
ncbi:MAG TPA: hypothetical protein VE641_04700, partial [Chthoniobacterales bacterium]|nr:hypothetical protein [Chthoniobacterales bacterium]